MNHAPSLAPRSHTTPGEPPELDSAPPLQREARIGWRGFLLIFGFWTLFGGVMAVNLLVSPLRDTSPPMALVAFTYLGAYAWAALTLPVFWLTRRINQPSGDPLRRFGALCSLALLLALVVSTTIAVVSSHYLDQLMGGTLSGPEGIFEIARYRYLNDLLACLLIVAAGVARDYFVRYQARQEETALLRAQLIESRMEVLRSQLNPHFLFNTLNAVSALVAMDPKGVRRIIELLSELLRYTLEGPADSEVTIDQEIRMLERYLQILEIRFRGRLETSIRVEDEVRDALVPDLILQPLAENAMKHGVGPAGGYGRIEVEARRDGSQVVLTVTDIQRNPGSETVEEENSSSHSGGFGLRQLTARLDQLYNGRSSFRLSPVNGGGTMAEIRVPYHTTAVTRSIPSKPEVPQAADA